MTILASVECSNGLIRRYDSDTKYGTRRPTHLGILTGGDEQEGVVREFLLFPDCKLGVNRALPLLFPLEEDRDY